MKQKAIIICYRKEEYDEAFEDNQKEYKCSQCGNAVLVGESVIRDSKQVSDEWRAICTQCIKNIPKIGKIQRPSPETMEKIRKALGKDIGEPEIRDVLKSIRNQMGKNLKGG